MDTIEVPVEIIDTILNALKWIVIVFLGSTAVMFASVLSFFLGHAQNKHNARESIIKNERANILHGINTGLDLSGKRYEEFMDSMRDYVLTHYHISPNELHMREREMHGKSDSRKASESVGSTGSAGPSASGPSTGKDTTS